MVALKAPADAKPPPATTTLRVADAKPPAVTTLRVAAAASAAAAVATLLAAPAPAFAKAAKAAQAAAASAAPPAVLGALAGGSSAALGGLVFVPAWTPLHVGLAALASLNLLAGLSEGSGQNTAYSKFSPTQKQHEEQAAAPAAAGEAGASMAAASGPAEARAWIAAWQKGKDAGSAAAAAAAPPAAVVAPAAAPSSAAVVSSRAGMAIIYAGGLLVAALAPFALPAAFCGPTLSGLPLAGLLPAVLAPGARPWLVAVLLTIHYLKRELEVFFLHRYSGGIPFPTAAMISTVYAITSLQYLYFAREASLSGFYATAGSRAADVGALGLALFFVGQAGNLYHHKLLADLRAGSIGGGGAADGAEGTKEKKKKAYLVPQGGLFPLVAAPHYLCEIVAWLGLALATQAAVPLVASAGMASYLAGRSASTRRWNEANLPGYPRERRRLVPYVW